MPSPVLKSWSAEGVRPPCLTYLGSQPGRIFRSRKSLWLRLSLATFAAMVRWTDQEIVDALIALPAKHGAEPKLRIDYYQRTLDKAREAAARFWGEREADVVLGLVEGIDNPAAQDSGTVFF